MPFILRGTELFIYCKLEIKSAYKTCWSVGRDGNVNWGDKRAKWDGKSITVPVSPGPARPGPHSVSGGWLLMRCNLAASGRCHRSCSLIHSRRSHVFDDTRPRSGQGPARPARSCGGRAVSLYVVDVSRHATRRHKAPLSSLTSTRSNSSGGCEQFSWWWRMVYTYMVATLLSVCGAWCNDILQLFFSTAVYNLTTHSSHIATRDV